MADIRAEPTDTDLHQCWCIAIYINDLGRQEVPCHSWVVRDRPFCNDCEDRHANILSDHVIVTTRPLPG